MQKKIFKKLKTLLVCFCIWSLSLTALLGVNLSHAKADVLPTVQFALPAASGSEAINSYNIPVTLSDAASSDMTINYSVNLASTAVLGVDYTLPADKTLTIAKDDMAKEIPLTIIDRHLSDGSSTVKIDLSVVDPTEATLGTPSSFTYTILYDAQVTAKVATDISANANGWFSSVPTITLSTNSTDPAATIYYQWNAETAGAWYEYKNSFLASGLTGENTLYIRVKDGSKTTIYDNVLEPTVFKIDTDLPVMMSVTSQVINTNQVQLSWTPATDVTSGIAYYNVYRGGAFLGKVVTAGYLDQNVTTGQNYTYQVRAVDTAGNESNIQTASKFVPQTTITTVTTEETPPVIQPAISYGVSTYKPVTVTPEVKAAETPAITNINTNSAEPQEESTGSNWNKLLLAISILIIAAGAAVGGYYGYQWWMIKKDDDDKPKEDKNSSKSRW